MMYQRFRFMYHRLVFYLSYVQVVKTVALSFRLWRGMHGVSSKKK